MLWKTNAPTTASSCRQVFHCVCDPTRPTGERMASRRRELSCPRMRTVGEGVGGRWISLLCLLMCVATGEVLASASPNSGGSTRGRTGGTSAGAWPSYVVYVCPARCSPTCDRLMLMASPLPLQRKRGGLPLRKLAPCRRVKFNCLP